MSGGPITMVRSSWPSGNTEVLLFYDWYAVTKILFCNVLLVFVPVLVQWWISADHVQCDWHICWWRDCSETVMFAQLCPSKSRMIFKRWKCNAWHQPVRSNSESTSGCGEKCRQWKSESNVSKIGRESCWGALLGCYRIDCAQYREPDQQRVSFSIENSCRFLKRMEMQRDLDAAFRCALR